MVLRIPVSLVAIVMTTTHSATVLGQESPAGLVVTLRSRTTTSGETATTAVEKKAAWDPRKTAIIVCDMWDDHWCKSAARRVAEMAGPHERDAQGGAGRGACSSSTPPAPRPASTRTRRSGKRAQTAPYSPRRRSRWSTTAALGDRLVLARRQARGGPADRRLRHGLRLQGRSARSATPGRGRPPRSRSPRPTRSPTTARRRGTCSPAAGSTTSSSAAST